MPRLLVLLSALLIGYLIWRSFSKLPASERKQFLTRAAVGGFLALILLALVSGKLNWLGALLMALLPFLKGVFGLIWRAMGLMGMLQGFKGGPVLSSRSLELLLVGKQPDGRVLNGAFVGQKLSAMSTEDLELLLAELNQEDVEAAQLLRVYLFKRFGEGWPGAPLDVKRSGGNMSVDEARALLNVNESASAQEIIAAHRKLIQKFHPDRGGNDYLAAQINLAKDKLLEVK